ncbi:hypothetical protein C8F04DRAFT_1195742 [Mycena alexandri]|uniref:Uncharacterized protein n=1 Tax=Mycena alexandri TaxID=1745969 RepID=A0AAD6WU99_9AGAR|nr:hypothetical protein C8F04DRAFT_1195742 [Mycena alexandri]
MQFTSTLVALLSLSSLALSGSVVRPAPVGLVSTLPVGCKASDRVLIETRNVTAGGHTIQISTKACSAEAVASRPLAKRQVENACEFGGSDLRCGTGGTAPLAADCTALESALPAALAAEGNPTLFEVAPQTAEEFSLGTCLWAWANNNPAGGATLEFCFSDLVQFGKDLDKDCIAAGATVGLVQPNSATLPASELAWFQEFACHLSWKISS